MNVTPALQRSPFPGLAQATAIAPTLGVSAVSVPATSLARADGVCLSAASQAAPASQVAEPGPTTKVLPAALATAATVTRSVTTAVGCNSAPMHALPEGYTALVLTDEARSAIFSRISPRWDPVCDHVTLHFGAKHDEPLPPDAAVRAVGYTTDGAGVEALVVQVNGSSKNPNGGTYHVTLSLADGRQAKESNDVIAEKGFRAIEPFDLQTEPRFVPLTPQTPGGYKPDGSARAL